MQTLGQAYSDLRFSPDQLYFSDDEYNSIATEFFGNAGPETLTNRDRAFLQAALFVAVDTSEKAGLVFSMYRAFVSAAPSMSIKKLLKKLATSAAKTAFKDYIDNDPKYSAVGRAGVQYSAFSTEWRLRVALDDPGSLTNFLKYGQ
jgi:hypothetical protein